MDGIILSIQIFLGLVRDPASASERIFQASQDVRPSWVDSTVYSVDSMVDIDVGYQALNIDCIADSSGRGYIESIYWEHWEYRNPGKSTRYRYKVWGQCKRWPDAL